MRSREPSIMIRVDPSNRGPGLVVIRILINGGNGVTDGLTIERIGSPSTVDSLVSELKVISAERGWKFHVIDGSGGI